MLNQKAVMLVDVRSKLKDKTLYASRNEEVLITRKREDGTFLVKGKKDIFIAKENQFKFL